MIELIASDEGAGLMRRWGVEGWSDPGAEYVKYAECCVFALVQQNGFVDIHMAMEKSRQRECRDAGAEILKLIGHLKLRAIILTDRPRVCNYAARMGFADKKIELLTTIGGALESFYVMWRKPGEYDGRSNQRGRRRSK